MFQKNPPKSSFDVYDHSLAVEFYSNYLYNVSPYSEFPIHQLIGRRGQAPPEVQRVAVNPMDLKKFLTRYPSIFKVTENNCVRLVRDIVDNRSKINCKVETSNNAELAAQCLNNSLLVPIDKDERRNPILELKYDENDSSLAVEYYSKILKTAGPNYSIHSLIGHRGQAPPEVQRVAFTHSDLKLFLSKFPNIFNVNGPIGNSDVVSLKKPVFHKKCDEGKCNSNKSNTDVAAQFYANILKKKMSAENYSSLPLANLIGSRSQASTVVQNCARNVKELHSLLSSRPETFTVLPGHLVTLRKSLLVLDDKDERRNPVSELKYDENDSALAVQYYSNILKTAGPNYSIHSLIGHRGQASPEVKKVALTHSDLKLFFSRFPNIFDVNGDTVTLKKPVFHQKLHEGKSDVECVSNTKKSNPDIAAQFYANILKERGYHGIEFPIQKLTGFRNKAPLEVQNCAKNPFELYKLFCSYPKIFMLPSRKSVILIESHLHNIVSKLQNLSLTSNDNQSNSKIAIEYYVNILRRWTSNSEFPIDRLMVYLNRAPLEVLREATDEEELVKFFLKHPDIFTVIQNKFVKLTDKSTSSDNIVQNTESELSGLRKVDKKAEITHVKYVNEDKGARTLRYFPLLECPENPQFPGTWEDHVLDNTLLITEEDECLEACEVIKKEKVIALDCEGYNLGRGIISLIQIALVNGTVYIFDIYELPRMISCGLKEIIESDRILKVINYCRNDCLNLKGQYDVNLRYIFDVSVAYHVIECKMMSLSNFKPAGFNQICSNYGVPTNSCKDDLKFIYITQPKYWLNRPLNIKMVSYAAFDVASLVPYLYCEFLKRIDQNTEFAVWKLSQKMCIT